MREGDRTAIREIGGEVLASGEEFPFERIEDFDAYWFAASGAVYVAEVAGEVVASYVLKPVQPGRGAHVANAGYMVARRSRGLGLGRALGEHSLEEARARGFRAMQFNYVVESNESAVRLWRELGFQVVATLPAAFRNSHGAFVGIHVMRRDL